MDWILLGLGNPGPAYSSTRHNAGFWVLDKLAENAGVRFRKPFFCPWEEAVVGTPQGSLHLVKPLTFMNRSGLVIPDLLNCWKLRPTQILVVVDQLDLPPGQLRLKASGSSAGHNGLKSVEAVLDTQNYPRLYVGIGRPQDGDIVSWVLGTPSDQDQTRLTEAVSKISDLLGRLTAEPLERLIGDANKKS